MVQSGNNGLYNVGKFKAPTLRNIALTAPYMHDGSIATLGEVVDHYAAGVGHDNPAKDPFGSRILHDGAKPRRFDRVSGKPDGYECNARSEVRRSVDGGDRPGGLSYKEFR
jgi:hypothetical protein